MSTTMAPSPLHHLTRQLEAVEALDGPAQAIGEQIRNRIPQGAVKDLLSGTWLGHPVHPLLTDVVIGAWSSASLLDLLGGKESADAATKLVGVGLAAYPAVIATGWNDWADTEPADPAVRRVGLIHAASNGVAGTLYGLSWRARRGGRHGAGAALALAGAAAMTAGGYLGAHLAYARGVGVDQTRFDTGPKDWTATTVRPSELMDGKPHATVAGETPVMLVRDDGKVHALHDRCSHRGCSLAGVGDYADGVIQCGCHGSRFRVEDGELLRGPAITSQPSYEVREAEGRIEVRLAGEHEPG